MKKTKSRILVVDDQPDTLKLIKQRLTRNGYAVKTATSGDRAFETLHKQEFDVLITEIQMQGINGIMLMYVAMKLYPDIATIVISGQSDIETATGAMRLGASNYLMKPLNIDALVLSVQKAIEKVQLVRENKKQQENLALTNRKLIKEINKSKMILNGAGEGIVGVDKHGDITFVNPAAEDLLGWDADELTGKNLHELTHATTPEGDIVPIEKCPICATFSGATWYQGTNVFFWRKGGTSFPVRYVSTPVFEDEKPTGAVIIFNDITERKKAEEKLNLYRNHLEKMVEKRTVELEKTNVQLKKDIAARKKAEKEAEERRQQLIEADKMVSLGTLVAGVAHEINNPNNFIMMNTPLLRRAWEDCQSIMENYYKEHGDFLISGMSYSEMRAHIPELFTGIRDGSERIKQIVLSLKNYSRQEPSDMSQAVDINETLEKALVLLANPIKKATNHLHTKYGKNMPKVKGNFQRIEQVLINVIQNACQALPDKSKKISIKTSPDKKKKGVCIEIKDEGIGIPKKHLKQIQDPFFTTKREIGGTGLGLSVSAGIIEEHHGHVEFDSKKGKGTTVRIFLPIEKEKEAAKSM